MKGHILTYETCASAHEHPHTRTCIHKMRMRYHNTKLISTLFFLPIKLSSSSMVFYFSSSCIGIMWICFDKSHLSHVLLHIHSSFTFNLGIALYPLLSISFTLWPFLWCLAFWQQGVYYSSYWWEHNEQTLVLGSILFTLLHLQTWNLRGSQFPLTL